MAKVIGKMPMMKSLRMLTIAGVELWLINEFSDRYLKVSEYHRIADRLFCGSWSGKSKPYLLNEELLPKQRLP